MHEAAAVVSWFTGLGFGLPGAYGLWYVAEHDSVWSFLGLPTYGEGPFEDIGIETSVPLLAGFVALCALELVAGALLWARRRPGPLLSFALLPAELAYWIGFALPFGPILGIARVVLVVAGRTRSTSNPSHPSAL